MLFWPPLLPPALTKLYAFLPLLPLIHAENACHPGELWLETPPLWPLHLQEGICTLPTPRRLRQGSELLGLPFPP